MPRSWKRRNTRSMVCAPGNSRWLRLSAPPSRARTRLAVAMRGTPFLLPHRLGSNEGLQRFERPTFPRLEDQLAGQVGGLATQQGQGHHPPRHDRVDGNRASQLGGAVMLMGLDPATALEDRCHSSIRRRRVYQRRHHKACLRDSIGTVVNNSQRKGLAP